MRAFGTLMGCHGGCVFRLPITPAGSASYKHRTEGTWLSRPPGEDLVEKAHLGHPAEEQDEHPVEPLGDSSCLLFAYQD